MLKYAVSTLLFCISLMSFGAEFVAGKDYEILKKVSNTEHSKLKEKKIKK